MKKSIFKRVCSILLVIISMACIVACCFGVVKKDYTEKYLLYRDIKSFSTLAEIKQYFSKLNIEYTIENSKLQVKRNNLFYVTVSSDGSCTFVPMDTIMNFERLDECLYSDVRVSASVIGNNLVEEISLKEGNFLYTKLMNRYYKYNIPICLLLFIASVMILASYVIAGCHSLSHLIKNSRIKRANRKKGIEEDYIEES